MPYLIDLMFRFAAFDLIKIDVFLSVSISINYSHMMYLFIDNREK